MAETGKIQRKDIVEEMRESYLDYAMSVIVARALPDVRDGLKPVQRRILFAMHEMGLGPTARFRKSAAIVGDVLGKYHPHGDIPVYDAMVRMAQDFSLRYPLIDGQGNWGSIDGDAAAAMRYSEARMTRISGELLSDIEKDTVDFRPNYDGSRREPVVLPAALPHLLLNGSLGIAVGMATSIPPHNLGEVIDALSHLISHPGATNDELMQFIRGPDFPTGGIIFNESEIRAAYATGRGSILARGRAEIVERRGGGHQIVITEIPYQVNKAELVAKIAELVRDKKIEGIRDLRDESDKDGLSIVIDLKAGAPPQKMLASLYHHTDLEKNFNLNLLALVDGLQPQVLSLKSMLEEFLKHREVVITRRTRYELERAKERAHILEGLVKALGDIDRVIAAIKKSPDRSAAHRSLVQTFGFSSLQSEAILNMKLETLAHLERQRLTDELQEKQKLIRELSSLLADRKRILARMASELADLKARYADPRRTELVRQGVREVLPEDLIAEEEQVIVLTRGGYIKRMRPEAYRLQKRGGKGIAGIETRAEDEVLHFLVANTHATLLFFTNTGKVYQTKTYELPEGTRTARGKAIVNFLAIGATERMSAILAIHPRREPADGSISLVTRGGIMKKVAIETFSQVRRSGLIAIDLKPGDELVGVAASSGRDELLLVTALGASIRFPERELRAMGRTASGVKAIRLKKGDAVVSLTRIPAGGAKTELLVVTANGYGKRTKLDEYRRQHRGGGGVRAGRITEKTGPIVAASRIQGETELIAISSRGQVIRTSLGAIPVLSRSTQGVRVMKLDPGDQVTSVTIL